MDHKLPVRKSLRINAFDYSSPGAYFITFCTCNKRHTLSRIVGAIHESPFPQLTSYGQIADAVIRNIPAQLSVAIDRYVIMPNHIHLIAIISEEDALREIRESPQASRSIISKLVGYIKMNASKAIHLHYGDISVWQRGYYDHVIRNQEDYNMIAEYIDTNPIRWTLDKLYTEE